MSFLKGSEALVSQVILQSMTSAWKMDHAPVLGTVRSKKAGVLGLKSRMVRILLIGCLEAALRRVSALDPLLIILLEMLKV